MSTPKEARRSIKSYKIRSLASTNNTKVAVLRVVARSRTGEIQEVCMISVACIGGRRPVVS